MLVLVAIDVKTDEKRNTLVNILKKMGSWARINLNLWAVQTFAYSVRSIRDVLGANIEEGESVFVADISESMWSCRGVAGPVGDFLHKKQRQELG
jgi:CRISPR/Cas system-associated endoribonuclease Cas2